MPNIDKKVATVWGKFKNISKNDFNWFSKGLTHEMLNIDKNALYARPGMH